jgi:hypothetical protein
MKRFMSEAGELGRDDALALVRRADECSAHLKRERPDLVWMYASHFAADSVDGAADLKEEG